MDPFEDLKRDVDLLGRALGRAMRGLSGEAMYGLEERVRALTKQLRAAPDAGARDELEGIVHGLGVAEAEGLARAFAIYFHLVNLAEERHRVRVNHLRELESTPTAPRAESFLALVGELKASGLGADEARGILQRIRLDLTFTAHPTESRRRTVRHHLTRIRALLDTLESEPEALEDLDATVALLWATEELRRTRPTVQDEVKGGLSYLPTTVWEALPRVSRALGRAFEAHYGEAFAIDPPVRFRSWIGGDRDGNPNVNAETLDAAQGYARGLALHRYVGEIDSLIEDLSAAQARLPGPPPVAQDAIAASELVKPGQFAGEPFRLFLAGLRARLRATLGERDGEPYADPASLQADLDRLKAALEASGLGGVARRAVQPLSARASVFGLELVSMDLREESSRHELAVAELLEVGGVADGYAAMAPDAREELLTRELTSPRPLAPVGYVPRSKELAVAISSLRTWRARGAYVISMTRDATDALEVLVLAREVGLWKPGHALPFDVVPLFETLGDLQRSPEVVRRLLRNPAFRSHVDGRGGLEIMIGYSDSNKDAGFLAASWALARAQHDIAATAQEEGARVSFFHGRGTSTARGGGPAGRAIASLPDGTVRDRVRLTEQGEALADRYAHPDLAVRHLEQLLYHFALAARRDQALGGTPLLDADRASAMDRAAIASSEAYRALLATPGFFEFFEQLTPIREISSLKIASRPVYRHGRVRDVRDLRAIPWVMAWTQVRANVPGWYGLHAGLATIPVDVGRRLYREWPFFRTTLDGAAMSLAKGDLAITELYARLVDPLLASRFLPLLSEQWAATRAILEETFEGPLLKHSRTMARSIDLRNPYVDPINHVQVELLARLRALPDEHPDRHVTEGALLTTLLGIAAGLRNTG